MARRRTPEGIVVDKLADAETQEPAIKRHKTRRGKKDTPLSNGGARGRNPAKVAAIHQWGKALSFSNSDHQVVGKNTKQKAVLDERGGEEDTGSLKSNSSLEQASCWWDPLSASCHSFVTKGVERKYGWYM